MEFFNKTLNRFSPLISALIIMILATTTYASIVVIGSLKMHTQSLTKDQVANFYLGKPVSLSTNERLQPFGQPLKSGVSREFYRTVLGWNISDVSSYWSSEVFSGQANQPATVNDDEAAITTVEQNPNAIAYVDSSTLQGANNYQIKILYGSLDLPPPDASPINTTTQNILGNSTASTSFHSENQTPGLVLPPLNQAQTSSPPQQQNIQPTTTAQNNSNVNPNTNTGDVWAIIQSQLQFGSEINNAEVKEQLQWYLEHRSVLNLIINNATPYIYYVYQETHKRNMPVIFTLLPLIESGYDPYSYSTAGAAGLWQMMPGTASSFGLDIDWWHDSRKDVISSTNAALNFLMELKQALGDWYLAAAAYDAGQGAIQAAMQRNLQQHLPTDLWSLSLSEEAREYVPRLLALAVIIKDPARYGVQLPNIPYQPFFVSIEMNSQLSLQEISQIAGVSADYIRRLNPGIRRFATAPDGRYSLLIPISRAQLFLNNLAQIAGKTHLSWQYHEVHNGETLDIISKNYHVDENLIRQVNGIAAIEDVQPNQDILVPIRLDKTYQKALGIVWPPQQPSVQQQGLASSAPNMLTPSSLESLGNNATQNSLSSSNAIQKQIVNQTKMVPSFGHPVDNADGESTNQPHTPSAAAPISDSDSLKSLISKIYGHT